MKYIFSPPPNTADSVIISYTRWFENAGIDIRKPYTAVRETSEYLYLEFGKAGYTEVVVDKFLYRPVSVKLDINQFM